MLSSPVRKIAPRVILLLFSLASCEDLAPSKVREKIDSEQLQAILSKNEDFGSFITIHHQNRSVINSLSNDESAKLQSFYQALENKQDLNILDAKTFLLTLSFNDKALNHLSSTRKFLNEGYFYNENDFNAIIIQRLSNLNQAAKTQQASMDCDAYCTKRAHENYPPVENDPGENLWRAGARGIYYAGCMDGCKNGPKEE